MDAVDVSIIIPVYNAAKYLAQCLDSVIDQTIKSKEIIVINDGSTDNSYEILKAYKKKFPKLIVINHKNSGASESRNAGLKMAKGEYVGFVDSDDFIKLTMFEKMYKVAVRDNSNIVICNYILYNSNGHQQTVKEFDKDGCLDKLEALRKFLLNEIKAYSCNKLFKRELFTQSNILFPDFKVCEDTPVVFLLIAHARKISIVEEPFYYYRQRRTSLTSTFSMKAIKDMLAGCYIMKSFITKDPKRCKELFSYYRVYMIKTLWVIHNKYWLQYCSTGVKSNYYDFKQVVTKEVKGIKVQEIIGNRKLTLEYKVKAILIKTRTYAALFSFAYKFRNIIN